MTFWPRHPSRITMVLIVAFLPVVVLAWAAAMMLHVDTKERELLGRAWER